jgi:serine/threonine-protein kinase
MEDKINLILTRELSDRGYILLDELGHGGMGSVYLVKNNRTNERYAAKFIWNNEHTDGKKEAEIMSKLCHNMLPQIKEYLVFDSYTVIIMEYINGNNMQEYIKVNGPVNERTAIMYLRQLADVLMYMHSQEPPLIYRDLKPANIMVENKTKLRLVDFGIARRFHKQTNADNDTMALGTPGYAAPEQLTGSMQSDVRTDIYSLGATMYYITTGIDIGMPPFEAVPLHMVRAGMNGPLEHIISRCLQRNPQSRYQSVSDIICELDEMLYIGKLKNKKSLPPINIMIIHSDKPILF